MSITLKGHVLNQRQLDAITPVINDYMNGKIKGQDKIEAAMVDALEKAGCPLGHDTGLNKARTVSERANAWIVNGHVGLSSSAIWSHMMGVTDSRGWNYPHDPDDLNRCLKLLEYIPEWRPRMIEMADKSPVWAQLATHWQELTDMFYAEVGADRTKSDSAPATFARMQALIQAGRNQKRGVPA